MNLKKSSMLKIALSIVAIIVFVFGWITLTKSQSTSNVGIFNVEIIDIDAQKINEKEISFNEDDKLVELLESNFANVEVENGMLMQIDELTTPEDWSTFICIYVNDEMSMVGINEIEINNGDTISFVDTKVKY